MRGKTSLFGGKPIRRALALTLTGAALLTLLGGCGKDSRPGSGSHHGQSSSVTETTVATEPPATIPADGNPDDVTCKGTYTVDSVRSDAVVARIEDQELTNGMLNILYRLQLTGFQAAEQEGGPDFEKPLDTQICEIAESPMTWQQYFLQRAIDSWQAMQSLERRSHEVQIQNELNFAVDQAKHEEYMKDMPINDTVLYGAEIRFRLTKQEQAFMDSLPQMLEDLARDKGYGTVGQMVSEEFGAGASEADFRELVNLLNYSYIYFIRNSYEPAPTEEELAAEIALLEPTEESVVDIRHILVFSDEATVLPDGKLEADEAVWNDSYKQADALLKKFRSRPQNDEVDFAVLANQNTRDGGSKLDGGFYGDIHKGQLIEPLDAWCFDPARQPGDTEMIQSDYGWHVVYFCARRDARTLEAEKNFRRTHMGLILEEAEYNYPMTLSYGEIELAGVDAVGKVTVAADLLYPDVRHERFDEVPVYIQQDYAAAPYGAYKVSSHGCGISALAMLSTYMTDQPLTPAILAAEYGRYNGLHGTDMRMFTEVPPELGYYLHHRTGVWNDVEANLKEGRMTISLQVKGYFTRGGHYLVLSELTDDGKVVLRDSNLFNYKRLPEHAVDAFPHGKLLPNCRGFWVYDNKFTGSDSCARCGDPTAEYAPRIFREDYLCRKCVPAAQRRELFLDLSRMF